MEATITINPNPSKGACPTSALRFGSIGKRALPAMMAGAMLCGMAPGDMSVAAFLLRADSVSRLGPLAIATPEGIRL